MMTSMSYSRYLKIATPAATGSPTPNPRRFGAVKVHSRSGDSATKEMATCRKSTATVVSTT